MNPEQFAAALLEKGIHLNEQQIKQFDSYYKMLVEWNKKMNLTALTAEKDVYLKHFYDSLTAAFYYDFNKNLHICDVGAGAGFPSIPLKICFPNLKVTIVDSLRKRINFLEELTAQLNLESIDFYHDRAETFGKKSDFREAFDVVTARAVARMSVLSELCLPITKIDGLFIAMKGGRINEEAERAKPAVELLGGDLNKIHTFSLPVEAGERSIFIINKKRNTPKKYPRKPGIPNKSPIE